MARDMAEDDGEFVVGQTPVERGPTQHPGRDLWSVSRRRDAPEGDGKHIIMCVRHKTMAAKQFADRVHALTPTANDAALATSGAAGGAFGLPGLIYERGIKASHSSGDNPALVSLGFDYPPPAGGDAEIDAENTFLLPHCRSPKPMHNLGKIIDLLARIGNSASVKGKSVGKPRQSGFTTEGCRK